MRKFERKDINPEIIEATAQCEDWESVQKLFVEKGFDLSEKTAKRFFDFTRETDLGDEELSRVAGGSCSSDSETDSSQTYCPA